LEGFNKIQNKLEGFIKKYYFNELIKGAILFFSLGLLYFLLTLFVEHFLWLNESYRTILFWLFIVVELGLIFMFIAIPIAKLFNLKKGINYADASKLIGKHFPEVGDKLLNVLQLNRDDSKTELLLANIKKKSEALYPIPFKLAVNFKTNIKYLKYTLIPLFLVLGSFVTGHFNVFTDSFERVVNYKTAYVPPAPFQFYVVNENLSAIENTNFKLIVKVAGDVIPDNVEIIYNDETYFLQQMQMGEFEYVFNKIRQDVQFKLMANNISSKAYQLDVIQAPSLISFEMFLKYPVYTDKKPETYKSTGNAVVPEGTKVTWRLNTKATDKVVFYSKDTVSFIETKNNSFEYSKSVYNNLNYNLSTSNHNLQNYENLAFSIGVVKDEYPELNLKMERDSVDLQSLYFYGQISDDYGFSCFDCKSN